MEASAAPTTDAIRHVTDAWMEGWNNQDADALVACIADDLQYTDPAWPEVMRSADDVRAFTAACWRAMPDMRFTEPLGLSVSDDGSWGCAPWHMSATLTGSFDSTPPAVTVSRV